MIDERSAVRSDRRRPTRRRLAVALTLLVMGTVATVLASGATVADAQSKTLRMAFSYDPGTLDPDIFYGNEALIVTTSCYEGLLRYKNNTTQLEPWLARSYTASKDSKVFTFKLRPNVRFVDGTPFTSTAMKYAFQRRLGVNAGPGYMVRPIARYETPDPLTLRLRLKTSIDPFLHWLASPYGTKAVSPALVKANATKKDPWAKEWMASHCAGTGPYQLSQVVPGQKWTMTSTSSYWGRKPSFSRVEIENIPSFATQQLKLKSGELDLMTHGILARDIESFETNSRFDVIRQPGISATNLWINSNRPNLKSLDARRAVAMALNRPELVKQVYGKNSVVNTGFFAPGSLPAKYGGQFKTKYNPAAARRIVDAIPSDQRSLSFVYTTDDAANQQLAGLVVAKLNAVGFKVSLRAIPITEVFNYPTYPDSKRPDGVIVPQNPDDASPPSFPQLIWISTPGSGAYFLPISPATDKIFFRAIRTAPHEKAMRLYGKAATMYGATHVMVPISNNLTVTVARKGISGVAVERQGLWTVRIPQLRG